MGNLTGKSPENYTYVDNLSLCNFIDFRVQGYIMYQFVRPASDIVAIVDIRLRYNHPQFEVLRDELSTKNAYCVSYRGIPGDYEMTDVRETTSSQITGRIGDLKISHYQNYTEVILTDKFIVIPGYRCSPVLLIEKSQIPRLQKNVDYTFTIRLLRDRNEFLIEEFTTTP